MRVVFLTHNYPRTPGDIAGAFLHPLALALQARGVDVRVVAPSDRGVGGRELLDGIPVRRVRYAAASRETLAYTGKMASAIGSLPGLLTFRRLLRAMRRGAEAELEGTHDGVVHAHWWIPGGLAAPRGVPMVLTCHGTDVQLLERFRVAAMIARPVFRRARVVSTVSRALSDVIHARTGFFVPRERIVPMPVAPLDRPVGGGGGGIVVIGRLTEQKRVHLAIEAFDDLRRRGYRGPLTVVGDGGSRSALEGLAARLGLADQVRFAGAVSPDRIPGFLLDADLALMPAIGEGLGLAAAEALIQGVPVIACRDGGGLLDIVPADGGGGMITLPDPAAMADAAWKVLGDPAARDAARLLGASLRERLAPDHVAARCLDWYRQALGQ